MAREFYSVEQDDELGKVIHYHGFLWERDNSGGERTEQGELADYACTTANWCYAQLGEALAHGDPFAYMSEIFSECQQYQDDISEGEHARLTEGFYGVADGSAHTGIRLHMSDLMTDTPCGDYFFDSEDETRFRFIPAREYANQFEDNVSDALEDALHDLMTLMKDKGYAPCAKDWTDEDNAYFAAAENLKEAALAELERLGLSVRSDGASF